MARLNQKRFRLSELQEVANEIAAKYTDNELFYPEITFSKLQRFIFGYYRPDTNKICINTLWNGIENEEISYTFLHELVHYIQNITIKDFRQKLANHEINDHDTKFLFTLLGLVLKYGTKKHLKIWVEEFLFYKFKLDRSVVDKTVCKILRKEYKSCFDKFYEE